MLALSSWVANILQKFYVLESTRAGELFPNETENKEMLRPVQS